MDNYGYFDMNFEEFEKFLLSQECYDNHDVFIIDVNQCIHHIDIDNHIEYQAEMAKHLFKEEVTIKIEQMESYFNYNDGTIHVFHSPKNGPTFPEHTDTTDVMIVCLDGVKTMEIEGKPVTLQPNENVYITTRTYHRALNYEKALMASHGIGDTTTLKRLHQNN